MTGFALAFARAIGEYGSVIHCRESAHGLRNRPLMIMSHLEEYDYAGASAIAVVMLACSPCYYWINKLQA